MQKHNSDIQTIQAILKGDKSAFRKLYDNYSRFYFLTCLRYTNQKSDAEDLLQESFIKIYKDLHQFDHTRGNFISWSKRVVINVCLQHLRKKNVLNNFENIIDLNLQLSDKAIGLDNLSLQELTKMIQQLPKGYRTVFNLYIIDGFSHKEISEELGISESTSKTQLMKAKKLLKLKIKESDYSLDGKYA